MPRRHMPPEPMPLGVVAPLPIPPKSCSTILDNAAATARSVSHKLIKHREPTPGTVRRFYGAAFGCGKPGCDADLYVVDESTGRRVLNSRVAHIHARREGGPRWNPDMSETDNRDVSSRSTPALPIQAQNHYPAANVKRSGIYQ